MGLGGKDRLCFPAATRASIRSRIRELLLLQQWHERRADDNRPILKTASLSFVINEC
jgi:hypothetical protein